MPEIKLIKFELKTKNVMLLKMLLKKVSRKVYDDILAKMSLPIHKKHHLANDRLFF